MSNHDETRLPADMEKTAILYRGETILAQFSALNGGWITRDGFLAVPHDVSMWWPLSRSAGIRPILENDPGVASAPQDSDS